MKKADNKNMPPLAYVEGFVAKCAAWHVDPEELLKTGQDAELESGILRHPYVAERVLKQPFASIAHGEGMRALERVIGKDKEEEKSSAYREGFEAKLAQYQAFNGMPGTPDHAAMVAKYKHLFQPTSTNTPAAKPPATMPNTAPTPAPTTMPKPTQPGGFQRYIQAITPFANTQGRLGKGLTAGINRIFGR